MTARPWLLGGITLLTLIFLLVPFVVVVGASFDSGEAYHIAFPPRGVTLAAYGAIPAKYLHAVSISLAVALAVAALATVIGCAAALGLMSGRLIGRAALEAFFRLPVQIPLVVSGAAFLQFYYELASWSGINLLEGLGGLIIAHTFVAIPYSVASIAAVLARFDRALEEAAESLGAGPWSTFWQVTFPNIRPGIVAGFFYAFIVSFSDVPIAIFIVQSKDTTIPVQLFLDMQFDFTPAMLAASTLVAAGSLALLIGVQRLFGFDLVQSRR
jgi:putative spermidine/putrescine transport system permease protein